MSPNLILVILLAYFALLFLIAKLTAKGSNDETFFTANRSSPWYLVAFGMVGASLSGVTFISVPGEVGNSAFSYLQFVFGNVVGYWIIAFFLLPLYYRINVVSIYQYLEERLGTMAYKTGAIFFMVSKVIGAAFRLFLVAIVLQSAVFQHFQLPFWATVTLSVLLIWVYTFRGGIKTVVWTDTLQTFFLLFAAALTFIIIVNKLDSGLMKATESIWNDPMSKVFHWDLNSKHFFWKQFIGGLFITIAMNGFDQDIMQKNLTCKNKAEAQKNMIWFSIAFLISVIVLMGLGVLLYQYANLNGIAIPARTDTLYSLLALDHLGIAVGIFFILGITAAAYSSADSALTSLTTSFCFDILHFQERTDKIWKSRTRKIVHITFSLALIAVVVIFEAINSESVVMAVFKAAGYTYGPILGLFSFGLFTKRTPYEICVPLVCIVAPLLSFWISTNSEKWFNGYQLGFELLLLNGLLTFVGLCLFSRK